MATIKGKYHVLDFPLGEEWIDKLLGRIVLHKEAPGSKTAPDYDENDEEIIPQKVFDALTKKPEDPAKKPDRLASEPFKYKSLVNLLKDFKDTEAHANLTSYFEAKASRKANTETTITALDVDRIDIDSIEFKFKKLLKNPEYAKQIQKILLVNGKPRTLGLVTGIFVANSLTVVDTVTKNSEVKAQGNLPVGQMVGNPNPADKSLDVGGGASRIHDHTNTAEEKIEVKSIFAVAYTDINLRILRSQSPAPEKRHLCGLFPSKKKQVPDQVDWEPYVDTSPGAAMFHGRVPTDQSTSTTSELKDFGKDIANSPLPTETDGPSPDVASVSSTKTEEPDADVPYVFKSPKSVF